MPPCRGCPQFSLLSPQNPRLNKFHHKLDFEDAKKHRTAQRVNLLFRKLEQHDPWYKLTMHIMAYYLDRLSASGRRAVEESFIRCLSEALDFYREIREAAGEALKINHARGRRKRA